MNLISVPKVEFGYQEHTALSPVYLDKWMPSDYAALNISISTPE